MIHQIVQDNVGVRGTIFTLNAGINGMKDRNTKKLELFVPFEQFLSFFVHIRPTTSYRHQD